MMNRSSITTLQGQKRRDAGIRAASKHVTKLLLHKQYARPSRATRALRVGHPALPIMSTIPPGEHPDGDGQREDAPRSDSTAPTGTQPELAEMDTTPDQPEETWDDIPEEIMELDTEDIRTRIRLIENDIRVCLITFLSVNQFNVGTRLCAQSSCG
jgi:hypothetical protein